MAVVKLQDLRQLPFHIDLLVVLYSSSPLGGAPRRLLALAVFVLQGYAVWAGSSFLRLVQALVLLC